MLSPELKSKLNDPAVKQAISYWVMYVVNQLGAVRSEKEIKEALFHKLGKRVSPLGINYIYTLAIREFETRKGIVQSVTGHGNN